MPRRVIWRLAGVAALVLGAHGVACAQAAQLAPGQVSGAELQAFVDADGLALGGVSLANGCQFFAKNKGTDRHLTVFCPGNMASWTVRGEGKVVGNRWCTKFQYPDGTSENGCEEFFKVGENKYELRVDGRPVSRVYRLVP